MLECRLITVKTGVDAEGVGAGKGADTGDGEALRRRICACGVCMVGNR